MSASMRAAVPEVSREARENRDGVRVRQALLA
jgi:hypothetical protein